RSRWRISSARRAGNSARGWGKTRRGKRCGDWDDFCWRSSMGGQPDLRLKSAWRWARSVDAAAEMLNVSPRTVRAQAVQLYGLGPKRMLRIRRLHRALACGAAPLAVWSDIASRTGYADQSH